MAIARLNIKCTECGEDIEIRRNCFNRKEADNYEVWAAQNIKLCNKCRFEKQKAESLKDLSEFIKSLPEIVGKSEKQITYAKNLRENLIFKNRDRFGSITVDYFRNKLKQLVQIPDEKLVDYSKCVNGYLLGNVEITMENVRKYRNLIRCAVFACSKTQMTLEMFSFVMSDAGKIIDCIKNQEIDFDETVKDVETQGFMINDITSEEYIVTIK